MTSRVILGLRCPDDWEWECWEGSMKYKELSLLHQFFQSILMIYKFDGRNPAPLFVRISFPALL